MKVEEPISLVKLTQSTHAHLLSFSVLFSLTGLIFAFTSYPTVLRCVLGPWVLLAMVTDISLWWLSRLCSEWGQYFAMGIIGTGLFAGVGLALQITLSLFNMYGWKGRVVLLFLFALVAGIAGVVYTNQIKPGLERKQQQIADATKNNEPKDKGPGTAGKDPIVAGNARGKIERMLTLAPGVDVLKMPWKAGEEGGMAARVLRQGQG